MNDTTKAAADALLDLADTYAARYPGVVPSQIARNELRAAILSAIERAVAAERAARQEAQRRLERMQEDAIRHQREVAQARANAEIGAAIEGACSKLPDGWSISLDLERGAGVPILYHDGERVDAVSYDGSLSEEINDMVQHAIDADTIPKTGGTTA
jgi:hypothetical protein